MFKYTCIFLFAIISLAACAEERTPVENTVRAVSVITMVMDWRQTRWMSKNYDKGYYETNDILGKYPTTEDVDRYFALLAISHYLFNRYGSKNFRFFINTVVITTHGRAAYNNYKIGVQLDF